jgi:hypothetical protein
VHSVEEKDIEDGMGEREREKGRAQDVFYCDSGFCLLLSSAKKYP